MILDTFNQEFGYELISCVPYAYWLNQRGELDEVITAKGAEPLYYFAKKVTINKEQRDFGHTNKAIHAGVPNLTIHRDRLQLDRWAIPPYAEYYKNDEYKFNKPTICICNRYNVEWGARPINFFSVDVLDEMFTRLKDKYQIVYFAVDLPEHLQDGAHSMKLGDLELCKRHPEVIVFQELLSRSKYCWNETMLRVFANCRKYITMNGGYSIMAAYFGGQNIIFTRPGRPQTKEITQGINSFNRWYPEFNNQQVRVCLNLTALLRDIEALYVKELPTVNILIRTHARENYFRDCLQSIYAQDYPNINIIVGCEEKDSETNHYTINEMARIIHYPRYTGKVIPAPERTEAWGKWFPWNSYLDIMQQHCPEGYIIAMDDDDKFTEPHAVSKMVEAANGMTDAVVFWRCSFPGRVIPSDTNWGKAPVVCDISGIGFMYHTRHVPQLEWGYWKRADYRVAAKLWDIAESKIFLNFVLTGLQDYPGRGVKGDKRKDSEVEEVKQEVKPIGAIDMIKVKTVKEIKSGAVRIPIGTEFEYSDADAKHMIAKGSCVMSEDFDDYMSKKSTDVVEAKPKQEKEAVIIEEKPELVQEPEKEKRPRTMTKKVIKEKVEKSKRKS